MRSGTSAAVLMPFLAVAALGAEIPEVIAIGPYLTHLGKDQVTVSWHTLRPTAGRVEHTAGSEKLHETKVERPATYHDVTLAGLPPATECRYRVVVDGAATPFFRFTTAPAGAAPFRFAKYGDTCTNPQQHRAVALAMRSHKPAFVVHTGDFIPQGDTGRRWREEFFDPARELLAECAVFPTLGDNDLRAIRSFCDYFRLPRERAWFTWSFGNVDFFALSPYEPLDPNSPQGQWLEKTLAASTAPWKIVALQEPPYSSGLHGSQHGVRRALLPVLLKHGVDMLLAGSEHSYERTHAIGAGPEPSANAMVHIISAGGGQRLYPIEPQCWTAHAVSKHHFCLFDVQGDEITLTAYSDANEPLDRVVLSKKGGKRSYGKVLAAEELELIALGRRFGELRFPAVGRQPQSRKFELTVPNPFPQEIQGEVSWEIEGKAWAVEPPRQALRVRPGGEATVRFEVSYTPQPDGAGTEPLPRAVLSSGSVRATVAGFTIESPHPKRRRRPAR